MARPQTSRSVCRTDISDHTAFAGYEVAVNALITEERRVGTRRSSLRILVSRLETEDRVAEAIDQPPTSVGSAETTMLPATISGLKPSS